MEDITNNFPEENYKNLQEILRGFSSPDANGNVFSYGTPLIGLVNNYCITNEPFDSASTEDDAEDELKVIPYDIEREIYKEINYGFLIRETDHGIFCIGKVVNDVITKLSDTDKPICDSLKIKYYSF